MSASGKQRACACPSGRAYPREGQDNGHEYESVVCVRCGGLRAVTTASVVTYP